MDEAMTKVGRSPNFKGKRAIAIVPAYNEEKSIEKVVSSLRAVGWEFVVVNDGSKDKTRALLEKMSAPHINLVQNLGIGGAVQTGYLYALLAGYDIAVQFDGDGQHDAAYLDALVQPIIDGSADLVIGSRFVGNESEFKSSFARRAGITILSLILKLVSKEKVYDVTSGFRAADKKAMKLFASYYPTDYPEPESIAYAAARGVRLAEVPVAMHEREGGSSSIFGLRSIYYMIKVGASIVITGGNYRTRRR